jgi:nucleoside-diphosphate-sugar epimerase
MSKILVTGGAGFIGFGLSKYLAKNQSNHVTVCDNFQRGREDEELKQFLEQKNVSFVKCDLTDYSELSKLGTDYDHVYHLAAINGTKNFYEMPDKVLRVNTLACVNILDWYLTTKGKKIMLTSSSETYAGTMRQYGIPIPTPENVPLCVEDVFNPRWSYGGSKILNELFFINYARQHKFDMSIIRYHNIYGGRMGYDHVIPEFCLRLFRNENPFKIMGGTETRAFCHIDDGVRATQMVMESPNTNNRIVHVGNSQEEISMQDMAKVLFKIAGVNPKLDVLPAPQGCVQRRCPDTTLLKQLTGFKPNVPLETGLKSAYDWYKRDYEKKKN